MMETIQHFFTTSWAPPATVAERLWMIIALPLLGALISGVFGRWLGRANVNLVACGMVAGSFLLSLLVFQALNDANTVTVGPFGPDRIYFGLGHDYGVWFRSGGFQTHL